MKHPNKLRLAMAILGLLSPSLFAADSGEIIAVSAIADSEYARAKDPKNNKPETYAFGQGGVYQGSNKDYSLDKLTLIDVATAIAKPLRSQNFIPATDPKKTDLLIMVYWGLTSEVGTDDSDSFGQARAAGRNVVSTVDTGDAIMNSANKVMSAVARDQADAAMIQIGIQNNLRDAAALRNARLLGYDVETLGLADERGRPSDSRRRDLLAEVEQSRYFVVLMAYDFKILSAEKKRKLLWVTRFSLPQAGNEFSRQLGTMASTASKYFGRNSKGLVHPEVSEGTVLIGETTPVGKDAVVR